MSDLPNLRKERLIHFLQEFTTNARDDNFLVVKYGNYTITEHEFDGEVINWILQYLQYMSCPPDLEKCLARKILQDIRLALLSQDEIDSQSSKSKVFPSLQLLQTVTNTVNTVCKQILHDETCLSHLASIEDKNSERKWSICSQKNGRRKMEDRHVIIPDLKVFLPTDLQARLTDDEAVSYYAVFDGHAGTDAAAYATSHLHEQLVQSKHYPENMELAFRDAFIQTDQKFIDKKLKSGTTAICSLIKGNKLYFSWLGDSQAILVRNGKPVKVVDPHKPDRSDEKARIEALGGAVMYWGTWRVNGQLAVSRAIGDGEYKPFVSAEPDVTTVDLDGTEDFIIVGCDGLWDTLSPEEAVKITFQEIERDSKNIDGISTKLATAAKEAGSGDNISIIVIFLKSPHDLLNTNYTYHQSDTSPFTGITSTCSFVLNDMNGDEKIEHLDGLTSPNISLNPFSSPSGGMTFSPDPFGATNGTNGNGIHADSASDASDQESLGHVEEFGLISVEQLKATTKPESPGIFSQSASPSPDADIRPDVGGETLQQLAVQHKGGDSGFISPAGATTSQPDGYTRDTEPDGDGSQLSHGSIHLMDDLLQMSAQQENDNEQLDLEDQQGEDTKSLEEILAECRENPEGCENMQEFEEDEDDSDSDEEIGEFSFIRTEAAGQSEQPSSQLEFNNLEAEDKLVSLDENLQKDEVDPCNLLGNINSGELEENNVMKEIESEDSDSEIEVVKKTNNENDKAAQSLQFSETSNQVECIGNAEPKPEIEASVEESDNLVLHTAETNAIEDEYLGEVETLVPTIKTNAIDDASHSRDLEEGSALSSLESQGSAPSSLESQPGNGTSLESHKDVWSTQMETGMKEDLDNEAFNISPPKKSFDLDSFNTVAGGPDRVIVACMDGPEESGCLVPQGREMPSPQEAILAVIDSGISAVPIMEDSEDGKENGIDHRIENESVSPASVCMYGQEESDFLIPEERDTPSHQKATFTATDNGPIDAVPIMEDSEDEDKVNKKGNEIDQRIESESATDSGPIDDVPIMENSEDEGNKKGSEIEQRIESESISPATMDAPEESASFIPEVREMSPQETSSLVPEVGDMPSPRETYSLVPEVRDMPGPQETSSLVPEVGNIPSPQETPSLVPEVGDMPSSQETPSLIPEVGDMPSPQESSYLIPDVEGMPIPQESSRLVLDVGDVPVPEESPLLDVGDMPSPQESSCLVPDIGDMPCPQESSCLIPEEMEMFSPQETSFTNTDDVTLEAIPIVADSAEMFSPQEANFINTDYVTLEAIPIVADSKEGKESGIDLMIENKSISPAPAIYNGDAEDHSEHLTDHEPEASVDSLVDIVGQSDIMFENDNVENPLVLKTPQENVLEETTQSSVANLVTSESDEVAVVADNNMGNNVNDPTPCDQVDVETTILGVQVDISCVPDVSLSGMATPDDGNPDVNLSAISIPDVNLSAVSIPDVNLSAMSTPDADTIDENAGAMIIPDTTLDTINVPDVNVIPATPTRTKSPSLKAKQAEVIASDAVAKEKPSKDGNKTSSKGPMASKAATSKTSTTSAKRTTPAKPTSAVSKTAGAKPATKPVTAASKTATSTARPIPATPRTTTGTSRPSTTTSKTRALAATSKTTTASRPTSAISRPTTTASKTTTAASRPTPATSRVTTTASRPATATSRPATATSRPIAATTRPTTAASRPTTATPRTTPTSTRSPVTASRSTAAPKPSAAAAAASTKVPPIKRPTASSRPIANGVKSATDRPPTKAAAAKPTTRPAARPTTGAAAPKAAPTVSRTKVPGTKSPVAGPAKRVQAKTGEPSKSSPTKPVPTRTAMAKKLPLNKTTAKSAATKAKTPATIETKPSMDAEVLTNGVATHEEDEVHLKMNGDVEHNAHSEINGVSADIADQLDSFTGVNGITEPISILDE